MQGDPPDCPPRITEGNAPFSSNPESVVGDTRLTSMFRQTTTLGLFFLAAAMSGGCSFHLGSGGGSPQPAYYSYQNGYAKPPRYVEPEPAPERRGKPPSPATPARSADPEPQTTPDRDRPKARKPKRTSPKAQPRRTSPKAQPQRTSPKKPKRTDPKAEPKRTDPKKDPRRTEPKKDSRRTEPKKTPRRAEPMKDSRHPKANRTTPTKSRTKG